MCRSTQASKPVGAGATTQRACGAAGQRPGVHRDAVVVQGPGTECPQRRREPAWGLGHVMQVGGRPVPRTCACPCLHLRRCQAPVQHFANQAVAHPVNRVQRALAPVGQPQRLAHLQHALGNHRHRHEPVGPHLFDQFFLADHTPGMPQEVRQQVEAAAFQGARNAIATQFPVVGAQREWPEPILLRRSARIALCSLSGGGRSSVVVPCAVLGHDGFPHLKRRLKHCQSRQFFVIDEVFGTRFTGCHWLDVSSISR